MIKMSMRQMKRMMKKKKKVNRIYRVMMVKIKVNLHLQRMQKYSQVSNRRKFKHKSHNYKKQHPVQVPISQRINSQLSISNPQAKLLNLTQQTMIEMKSKKDLQVKLNLHKKSKILDCINRLYSREQYSCLNKLPSPIKINLIMIISNLKMNKVSLFKELMMIMMMKMMRIMTVSINNQ